MGSDQHKQLREMLTAQFAAKRLRLAEFVLLEIIEGQPKPARIRVKATKDSDADGGLRLLCVCLGIAAPASLR